MKKILGILILAGLVVTSAGCISFDKGGVILSFGNETYTLPLNQSNQSNSTLSNETQSNETQHYVWEQNVAVNKTILVNVSGEIWQISIDYDVIEQKFGFFVTDPQNNTNLYYEPVNMTIAGDVRFYGEKYFTGTNVYLAHVKLESSRKFEVSVS